MYINVLRFIFEVFLTLVAIISSNQCLSLIAGFCRSVTALKDVIKFFIVDSITAYGSLQQQSLISEMYDYISELRYQTGVKFVDSLYNEKKNKLLSKYIIFLCFVIFLYHHLKIIYIRSILDDFILFYIYFMYLLSNLFLNIVFALTEQVKPQAER